MKKRISLIVSYLLMLFYAGWDYGLYLKGIRYKEHGGVNPWFPSLKDLIFENSLVRDLANVKIEGTSFSYWGPMVDFANLVGYTCLGILLYFGINKIIDVVTKIKKREVVKNEN